MSGHFSVSQLRKYLNGKSVPVVEIKQEKEESESKKPAKKVVRYNVEGLEKVLSHGLLSCSLDVILFAFLEDTLLWNFIKYYVMGKETRDISRICSRTSPIEEMSSNLKRQLLIYKRSLVTKRKFDCMGMKDIVDKCFRDDAKFVLENKEDNRAIDVYSNFEILVYLIMDLLGIPQSLYTLSFSQDNEKEVVSCFKQYPILHFNFASPKEKTYYKIKPEECKFMWIKPESESFTMNFDEFYPVKELRSKIGDSRKVDEFWFNLDYTYSKPSLDVIITKKDNYYYVIKVSSKTCFVHQLPFILRSEGVTKVPIDQVIKEVDSTKKLVELNEMYGKPLFLIYQTEQEYF